MAKKHITKYTDEELSKEAFVEDTRREFLGKETHGIEGRRRAEPIRLDWITCRDSAWGLGDENPIFCDPEYAAKTRWGSQIAPPTIMPILRYPMCHGTMYLKPYRANTFYSGDKIEYFDVLRPGDTVRTSSGLVGSEIKQGKKGPLIFYYAETKMWNQHDRLVAKQRGTLILIELPKHKTFGDKLHYQREIYKYSDEEIERIAKAYENEYRRGADTLYWEDVKVGDKLPTVVKGPLLMGDFIQWRMGDRPLDNLFVGPFKRQYDLCSKSPYSETIARYNPATNCPWDHLEWEHEDAITARYRGMPLPYALGVMTTQIGGPFVTNWMGDDGFLKMFDTQIRKPWLYGDTVWFDAEVVKKYKVTEEGIEYGAVDIKGGGVNQLGEMVVPVTATVYLPSPGHPLEIPIPVKDKIWLPAPGEPLKPPWER